MKVLNIRTIKDIPKKELEKITDAINLEIATGETSVWINNPIRKVKHLKLIQRAMTAGGRKLTRSRLKKRKEKAEWLAIQDYLQGVKQ